MKACTLLLLLLCLALPVLGQRGRPFDDTRGEGKALVQDLLTRMPTEGSEIQGLLKIRPAEGPIVEIPVKLTVRVGQVWEDAYETQPIGGRPGEVLLVRHRGEKPNEYFHTVITNRATPLELQPLHRTNVFRPFAGSDFFIGDLGLEFLHWPSQKIIAKDDMRKGRSCRVVESLNPQPGAGSYSKVLSWVDYETGGIIRAEAYDHSGTLLKEFSIRKITRSEGRAQLREIEIRNDQTDSRTRLEFNVDIDDR